MKRKIAFVELFFHHEVLLNLCRLLARSNYEVSVFTTRAISKSIGDNYEREANQWFFKKEEESAPAFLERQKGSLDECDIIVFNTLAAHFKFFATFQLKAKTILIIHNAHTFLQPSKHRRLPPKIGDWPKAVLMMAKKVGLDSEYYYREKVLEQINYLSFPSEEVEKSMRAIGYLKDYQTCAPLPFTYFEGKTKKETSPKIRITITGTIDKLSKDYELVFEAFSKIKDKLKHPIELCLLGLPKGVYGKKVVQLFQQLKGPQLEVITFDKEVPQKKYEAILQQTDFVIVPLRKVSIYSIYEEHYGKSKVSGGINDMIRFGLPGLVVQHYPLNENLQQITATYENETELASKLLVWINEQLYEKLEIEKALEVYTLKETRKSLIETLDQIM